MITGNSKRTVILAYHIARLYHHHYYIIQILFNRRCKTKTVLLLYMMSKLPCCLYPRVVLFQSYSRTPAFQTFRTQWVLPIALQIILLLSGGWNGGVTCRGYTFQERNRIGIKLLTIFYISFDNKINVLKWTNFQIM